jgi:hypothetical protein
MTTGICEYPVLDDQTPCDDGDACTRLDECVAGVCTGTDPVLCPEAEGCYAAGTCSKKTGECTVKPLARGSDCDDGDPCTRDDTCDGRGACAGEPYECPALPCRTDTACDGTGECTFEPAATGTTCDDGDPCTIDDACDGTGACTGISRACEPPRCGTNARCEGGECVFDPLPQGTGCDDDDPCTMDDTCNADGTCAGILDPSCNAAPDVTDPGDAATDLTPTAKPASSCTGGSAAGDVPAIALLMLASLAVLRRRRLRTGN